MVDNKAKLKKVNKTKTVVKNSFIYVHSFDLLSDSIYPEKYIMEGLYYSNSSKTECKYFETKLDWINFETGIASFGALTYVLNQKSPKCVNIKD